MIEATSTAQSIGKRLETVFGEFGQRNTIPRQRLIELLTALALTGEGFTVEDLWNKVTLLGPGVGRATVFRAVKNLVEKAILDSVDFPDGTRLYRVCGERLASKPEHHHHLACQQCHKVVEIHYCLDADSLVELAENEGFELASHSVTVFGLCSDCQPRSYPSS